MNNIKMKYVASCEWIKLTRKATVQSLKIDYPVCNYCTCFFYVKKCEKATEEIHVRIMPVSSTPPPQSTTLLHSTFKLTIIYSHIFICLTIISRFVSKIQVTQKKATVWQNSFMTSKIKAPLSVAVQSGITCVKKKKKKQNTEHFNPNNLKYTRTVCAKCQFYFVYFHLSLILALF